MKAQYRSILTVVALAIFNLSIATVQGGVDYITNNNGTITIARCSYAAGAVVLPSEVGGLPVTSIGDYAFYDLPSLTSVTIPNSVTNIGPLAFLHCDCNRLTAISVHALNPAYTSIDGVLFDRSGTTLIHCPAGKAGTYTIPNGVTNIGDSGFAYCRWLNRVTIPESVSRIGEMAFYSCTGLESMVIPDSVTSIGNAAFEDCYNQHLTRIAIGNAVTNIGERAFSGCTSLTSISIPNSVTSIGDRAFSSCTGLTNAVIGNSVTSIGDNAFGACASLTSISIPNSVTNIGSHAFSGCTSLTAITVAPLNAAYRSVEGVLFDKNQTTLIKFPEGKAGSYAIPSGVTNIDQGAFESCTGLTSVTIPDSVTTIGKMAFAGLAGLTNVVLGSGVTCIGAGAFQHSGLTTIRIPDTATTIIEDGYAGYREIIGAFHGCGDLTTVIIGDGVRHIGIHAFTDCTNLTNVTIGNSVTNIGERAFSGCTSLTSITIPNSVTSLGSSAFVHCTSLTAITVDALNGVYTSVDGVLFNKSRTTLVRYPSAKAASTYPVPSGVTAIENWAFEYCASLTSITIPNSVTSIGSRAFSGCTNLMAVYFCGAPPEFGEWIPFDGSPNATIYYLPGTIGWDTSDCGCPTAPWVLPYPVLLTTAPSFGIQTNQFGFRISWATNASVVVEASTTLANPVWWPVSTNTLVNGWSDFSDAEWTNYPVRLYRVRSL